MPLYGLDDRRKPATVLGEQKNVYCPHFPETYAAASHKLKSIDMAASPGQQSGSNCGPSRGEALQR